MKRYLFFFILAFNYGTVFAANESPKHVEIENAYEDSSGRLIIRFKYKSEMFDKDQVNPDFFGNNRAFYGTEKNLFQLQESGFGGTSKRYSMSFVDPRVKGGERDQRATFYAGVDQEDMFKESPNYTLVCGDKAQSVEYKPLSKERIAKLQTSIRDGKVPLNSLPQDSRKPEYIFKQADGTIIYVDASEYNYSYESYRFFVGKPGAMKEMKIKDVERYRDGGTTYIKLENGQTLFSPTAFDKTKKPTWNGNTLERVDAAKFDLASMGIKGVPSGEADLHTPCDKFYPAKYNPSGSQGDEAKPAGAVR